MGQRAVSNDVSGPRHGVFSQEVRGGDVGGAICTAAIGAVLQVDLHL